MQQEEYYTNKKDDQFNIKQGIPKIFSYSLTVDKIKSWNNKFIGLALNDKEHIKSLYQMTKDGILKKGKM